MKQSEQWALTTDPEIIFDAIVHGMCAFSMKWDTKKKEIKVKQVWPPKRSGKKTTRKGGRKA